MIILQNSVLAMKIYFVINSELEEVTYTYCCRARGVTRIYIRGSRNKHNFLPDCVGYPLKKVINL